VVNRQVKVSTGSLKIRGDNYSVKSSSLTIGEGNSKREVILEGVLKIKGGRDESHEVFESETRL